MYYNTPRNISKYIEFKNVDLIYKFTGFLGGGFGPDVPFVLVK